MVYLAAAMTAAGVGVALWTITFELTLPAWASVALSGLLIPLVAGVVFIRFNYWKTISNSVEVTERQFAEIHVMYRELVERMGIDPIPRLYITNGNGVLNAFASKCRVRRSYVIVFSDLLEIAYEQGDWDGVRFALAHELGHVKCNHVALWRTAIMPVPRLFFLGRSVIRAQEYTADRCAAYYAPAGARSMLVLYAGKRMYRHCDMDVYEQSVRDHRDGFWLRVANFLADHAVGFRRMEALADVEANGWDVHGRML